MSRLNRDHLKMPAQQKTARLMLRPLSDSDQSAAVGILTDDTVKETYMIPDFSSEEEAVCMFARLKELSVSQEHYIRGIYLEKSLIGWINDVEVTDSAIELGWVIHPEYQGRGYATEAVGGAMKALFDAGFSEIRASAFEENMASRRVMEKNGMRQCPDVEMTEYRGRMFRCICYVLKKN